MRKNGVSRFFREESALFGAYNNSQKRNRNGKQAQIRHTFLAGSHISPLTETGAPMSTALSMIPTVRHKHISRLQIVLQ